MIDDHAAFLTFNVGDWRWRRRVWRAPSPGFPLFVGRGVEPEQEGHNGGSPTVVMKMHVASLA